MAKLNIIKRIVSEDFEDKDRALVDKLAFPLNQFIEQVASALNKNLTIADNLPFEIKSFNVTVNASGTPTPDVVFKSSLKVQGLIVIKASNIQNTTALTGAPFIQFNTNAPLVTVTKVLGIPADTKFFLTTLLIS